MAEPSTGWSEQVAADEGQRFEQFAGVLTGLQRVANDRFGLGRAFHRKGVAALRATLEIPADLPAHAKHGAFAQPGRYDALVRLSNGAGRPQSNREPDIRGFAIAIRGVQGPSALGGTTDGQDFLLINREVFGFKDVGPFVDLAVAASKGPLAIVAMFVRTRGLFRGLAEVRSLLGSVRKPFSGFLTEPFFSAVPVKWGPYAARLRLLPAGPPRADALPDIKDELWARLKQPSVHQLQAQFFVDEARTPIEDGSANWDEAAAPYVTIATLTLPAQSEDPALAADVEARGFDPWHALEDHRPLGHVMRARKAAYFASQQARKAPAAG
jgi:hypothetical protein